MTGSAPRKTRAMMYEQQLCHLPASVDEMYWRIEALASIESRVSKARSHSNIKILLDDLLEGRIDRKGLISQLSGSEYARTKRQIEDVYARRLQVSAAEWRAKMRDEGRRVQTIWIFGPAGTGNSSLAKQYAQSKGEPFFVSGSTRDVFQGYAGQHTIILDELRPSSIPYADLLRVTDPYAIEHEVMAPRPLRRQGYRGRPYHRHHSVQSDGVLLRAGERGHGRAAQRRYRRLRAARKTAFPRRGDAAEGDMPLRVQGRAWDVLARRWIIPAESLFELRTWIVRLG